MSPIFVLPELSRARSQDKSCFTLKMMADTCQSGSIVPPTIVTASDTLYPRNSSYGETKTYLYQLHNGLNREFSGNQDGQLVFLR